MVILSKALPSDEKEDPQDAQEMNKETRDNNDISTPSADTKCVSLVSDLTFCSIGRSTSPQMSFTSSKSNNVKKKKKKRTIGLKRLPCNVVNDNLMDPYNGKLRCRLRYELSYWPVQVSSQYAQCQMHNWLEKVKYRGQMMHCEMCNVSLCLDCYKPFHNVPTII